jgi:uncharacterized protein YbjT (DUF2867 family)
VTAPILVTGAPGNVGTPLVLELRALGAPVRVAAWDPDAAARAFGPTADIVTVDIADPATFGAFDGIERMFLLRPPAIADVKGVVAPALGAARRAGVRHVTFLSIQGAERNRLVPHRRIEDAIRDLGFDWTFVRAAYFMQNLATTHAADIRERDELFVPAGRRSRTAHVDARDVAAVAARSLVDDGHAGRAWEPTGPEALTYDECAAHIGRAVGRPIRYADPAPWTYWRRMRSRGMPREMIGVTLGIYTAARLGLAARVTDHVKVVTGRPPRTFAAFAVDAAAAWGTHATPDVTRGVEPATGAQPSG